MTEPLFIGTFLLILPVCILVKPHNWLFIMPKKESEEGCVAKSKQIVGNNHCQRVEVLKRVVDDSRMLFSTTKL